MEFAKKKLSKLERRQTNGYRMRFIVNFNQRIAMWQFGIILPLILPIPLEAETTPQRPDPITVSQYHRWEFLEYTIEGDPTKWLIFEDFPLICV